MFPIDGACTGVKDSTAEFTWIEGFAFCLAWIAIQLCSETFNQWGTYFYSATEGGARTIYVPIGLVGVMFIIATVWDALTSPVVGTWSDRTQSRVGKWRIFRIRGRRRPFIFWGSILMVFSFVGAWYPPVDGTSTWNFLFGTFMLCAHWLVFTITTIPLLALQPEVARSTEARVKLGIWVAVGSVLGLALANVLSGVLLGVVDPAPIVSGVDDAGEVRTVASPEAYRRLALYYALGSVVLFQFLVWTVRERFDGDAKQAGWEGLAREARDVTRNRPFLVYFAAFLLFSCGLLASQRALPYWVEIGLGGNEAMLTLLLGPYVIACLLTYPFIPWLQRRLGVKWTVFLSLLILTTSLPWMYSIGISDASTEMKTIYGALLFAYAGVGQGIMYVMMTPLLGEIIDYDETYSGERREALYNGLSGVAWKASMAGSILIATQSMAHFGNSADEPLGVYLVGPLAGLCGLLGCVAMLFYPIFERRGPESAVAKE